ncbi:MAG: ABC transporter ATP-binding protein [Thermodesulfobacteriota bacterium]
MLRIESLSVHYDGAEALSDVSLTIPKGSIIALLGANGAGKTTLLRTISGLKSPTMGKIWFQDHRIENNPPEEIVKLGIAHCPEGRRVYPFMTVLENLQMGAYLRRDQSEIKRDLKMIYERFPVLKERTRQKAGTLSGGEQQMVAIARALMSNPRLLLMDEPSLGLSPIMVMEVARIIGEIQNTGLSVLLVEQNARMALETSNYAYVLEKGKVRLEGHSKEVANDDHVKKAYLGI